MTHPLSPLVLRAQELGLSPLAIGKATGLSHVTVREALAGETDPRLSTMQALCAALGARVQVRGDREVTVRRLRLLGADVVARGGHRSWREDLEAAGLEDGWPSLPGRVPRISGAVAADGFYAGASPATHLLRLNFPSSGGSTARLGAEIVGAWLAADVLGSARVLLPQWLPFYRLKGDPRLLRLIGERGADPTAGLLVARHDVDLVGQPLDVCSVARLLRRDSNGSYAEQLKAVWVLGGPEAAIELLERMLLAQLLGLLGLAPHKTSIDFASGQLRPWSGIPAGALLFKTTDYLGPSVSTEPHTEGIKDADLRVWWAGLHEDRHWAEVCRARLARLAWMAHERWPVLLSAHCGNPVGGVPELADAKRQALLDRLGANRHLRTEFGSP